MITCASCAKQNQDHYKFCLGCGMELPRELPPVGGETAPHGVPAVAPKPTPAAFATPTPAAPPAPARAVRTPTPAVPVVAAATPAVPSPAPEPSPEPAAAEPSPAPPAGVCPQCGFDNPDSNRFCASCGFKLEQVAAAPAAAPKPAPRPADPEQALSGIVLTALNPDGAVAGTFPLKVGTTLIGRLTDPFFDGDLYLSPEHARFLPDGESVRVTDLESLNGVFRKLLAEQPCLLAPGQVFRIGQELIRFEALSPEGLDKNGVEPMGAPIEGYVGRIVMVLGRESTGTAFPVPETGLNLGRERGEVLFSDDGYVSGLHCRISHDEGGDVYLTDLGSSNGTFVRLCEDDVQLVDGDVLLMGQQLFRITYEPS